jgi:hypothetical protein
LLKGFGAVLTVNVIFTIPFSELLDIVDKCPEECETLVSRIIHVLTDKVIYFVKMHLLTDKVIYVA